MGDQEQPLSSGTTIIKMKKKDDKYRKRDPRSWDNLKKIISCMGEEEKIDLIGEKYNELYTEHRNLNALMQVREKQITVLQKDRDREQADLTKAILAKGHLENLCRELQKQNKAIKEENIARVKEEEERRREVANTFTERLNTLTNLITESKDKSNKVKEENQNMTDRLTELYEQYQQRESHLDTMTKQLELQKKLTETTIKKNQMEFEAERQGWLQQKKTLERDLEQSEGQIRLLQENVKNLQAHVDVYKSQYSEFETTMAKSNKVFENFKEEMTKMNKQMSALEIERNDWRSRWQSSAQSLITLSEQLSQLTNELKAADKKIILLQKLCRQLQVDRATFIQQLKDNNIEPKQPPNAPAENNETESNGSLECLKNQSSNSSLVMREIKKIKEQIREMVSKDQLSAKEELLSSLKEDLANLQSQCQSSEEVCPQKLKSYSKNKTLKSKVKGGSKNRPSSTDSANGSCKIQSSPDLEVPIQPQTADSNGIQNNSPSTSKQSDLAATLAEVLHMETDKLDNQTD